MTKGFLNVDSELRAMLIELVRKEFKRLIETKHLYQSIKLDFSESRENILKKGDQRFRAGTEREFDKLFAGPWFIHGDLGTHSIKILQRNLMDLKAFEFQPPDVRLFCSTCGDPEPYNLLWVDDFLEDGVAKLGEYKSYMQTVQVFAVSYMCQSCKKIPEVFLIRRNGPQLMLCGRAPIERVEVPTVIPKSIRNYYSDAIVAHQSGQTLAGNFLLRTLLEQWAIKKANVKGSNDHRGDLFDNYMQLLPKDFSDRFPSMKKLYEKLSQDIHEAIGSPDLFGNAVREIEEHFDALRLFKLFSHHIKDT